MNKPKASTCQLQLLKDTQSEMRAMIELQFRNMTLNMVNDFFRQEVAQLCGKPFERKSNELCHRAGSDPGSVIVQGQRMKVKKPRVKQNGAEVELESYSALQGFDLLSETVMKHMLSGVSTRDYEPLLEEIQNGTGLSKSTVSKVFKQSSYKTLEAINNRSLREYDFFSIMIDGIEFQNRTVVVALGITTEGEKLILGLREGSTENSGLCVDLFDNLIERGLDQNATYLFVIDGARALRKAIDKVFSSKFVQRCAIHKLRNIKDYLDKRYHAELERRMKQMHAEVNYDAAVDHYNRLRSWLGNINHQAQNSLLETNKETLTVIKLKTQGLLRKTLFSTNPIESAFSLVAARVSRVKNWKTGKNQLSRWAAATLTSAEKRFKRVQGHKQIPILINEIKKQLDKNQQVA